MIATRQRNAWIWLAVAFMAVSAVARMYEGDPGAAPRTNPVLEFLAGQQDTGASAPAPSRILPLASTRHAKMLWLHSDHPGAWMAMLPVLFVGLVAPLSLVSPRTTLCIGRPYAAATLLPLFQRPPPTLLL
jgi:hypothetical protein